MEFTKQQLDAYIQGLYDDDMELSSADYQLIINYILSNGEPDTNPRDLIQVRRGNEADLPVLAQGEIAITLDTHKIFAGGLNGNIHLNPKLFVSVKDFGAKGDGVTDDTEAIQRAFDTAQGTLFFDFGTYKVTSELLLTRNLDIQGVSQRVSSIRGDNLPPDKSIIKVAFDDNYGFLDIRHWRFENLAIFQNGGGKHALHIAQGFSINTSLVRNCNFFGNITNGGYDLYIDGGLAHSEISLNTFNNRVFFSFGDANVIQKNLFFGTDTAITLDVELGVYNTTIIDNTIVNRDGALHIINGDSVRFTNNQVELFQGTGVNQSSTSSMLYVEGRDREVSNILISENNFGGGTSLDHLIYIDKAYKTVIEKNKLLSVNVAEVVFTSNARHSILAFDNTVIGSLANPRTRTNFKANVIDNGVGTCGVLKTISSQSDWGDLSFYKDAENNVHFPNAVYGVTITPNTWVYKMPTGFEPFNGAILLAGCTAGLVTFTHQNSGDIQINAAAGNQAVTLNSYPCQTND